VYVQKKKMMMKSVIDYKIKDVPSIKHGFKTIKRTKTRTVPGTKKITILEEVDYTEVESSVQDVEEEYETKETQYRTGVRRVKRIRMVPEVVTQDFVEYDTQNEMVPTSKWSTKQTKAMVKVPPIDDGRNDAPLNLDPSALDDPSCPCF